MPEIDREPWELSSMEDLLSVAGAMEQEAIDGYRALSARMEELGRPDLISVFQKLIAEEEAHLSSVGSWQRTLGLPRSTGAVIAPDPLFDDEGTGVVSPALVSAYHAFSMAVRNEERAFVFWTYVASNARSDAIQLAAERMAREELNHIATLRRERRRAFHEERGSPEYGIDQGIAHLERALAALAHAAPSGLHGNHGFGEQALHRAAAVERQPLTRPALLDHAPKRALTTSISLHELLLDCYLSAAETENDSANRQLAQRLAGEIVRALVSLRSQR